jgi:hypothetical protein
MQILRIVRIINSRLVSRVFQSLEFGGILRARCQALGLSLGSGILACLGLRFLCGCLGILRGGLARGRLRENRSRAADDESCCGSNKRELSEMDSHR